MSLPEVPGILSAAEVQATAATIADWQLPNGMIPWFPGGHADPWNHIEATMALAVTGHLDEAEAAYKWLLANQHENGAWHQYYLANEIEDAKFDANAIAYVATGVWHHWLLTADRGFLEVMWPAVERAIDFVLDLQTPRGEILWARHPDGTPWSFALLTGSASICHSLRCAVAIAEAVGQERPDWELSLGHLAYVVKTRPSAAFAPKDRWAMDWYYPVLGGAITGAEALSHLSARHDDFVVTGSDGKVLGIRCVSDKDWATAAETGECAMAHLLAGNRDLALDLLRATKPMRRPDGRYLTGIVYPDLITFPADECSTYTAAAVVLAADALGGSSPASGLFIDHSLLPQVINVETSGDHLSHEDPFRVPRND